MKTKAKLFDSTDPKLNAKINSFLAHPSREFIQAITAGSSIVVFVNFRNELNNEECTDETCESETEHEIKPEDLPF